MYDIQRLLQHIAVQCALPSQIGYVDSDVPVAPYHSNHSSYDSNKPSCYFDSGFPIGS